MDKGTTDTGKRNAGSKCSGWALAPFAVFATFYIGLSLAAGDFYKVPMTIAFILASFTAIAFGRKCSLAERIETLTVDRACPQPAQLLMRMGKSTLSQCNFAIVQPIFCTFV